MSLLKEIFAHEVFPSVGCTEPISCAYAAAAAAEQLGAPVKKIELIVDMGTYKNGSEVIIPKSGGNRGNAIAAAIGAIIAKPDMRMEILQNIPEGVLKKACELVNSGNFKYSCKRDEPSLYIEIKLEDDNSHAQCIIKDGHTNIVSLKKNDISITQSQADNGLAYRDKMRQKTLCEVLREIINIDSEDRAYIQKGIDMNMAISEKGIDVKKNAYYLHQMVKSGYKADDLFYRVSKRVSAAVDARMGGVPQPIMTSGGSGNQGVLTILLPYIIGRHQDVELSRIQESIAIGHAVNSYIKCFTGELSTICGCAISASIASAIALVYQRVGIDEKKFTFAVNNIIGDLCGMMCDGAKFGCSMKIVTGAETAMRSAFMALSDYGISENEGMLGRSIEESIRNLSTISLKGMGLVNLVTTDILQGKTAEPRLCHLCPMCRE
ncbi:MAG: L-serine ammonia-lyase, iron-sulfur-dependent, subunit alpha [bacterium]